MAKLKEKLRLLDWGNHLLNFLGTCLGVLLALYLSNYQQHRRDHQRLQIAIENIIAEIQENYNKTKKHLEKASYQLTAMQALSPLINEQDSLVGTEAHINKVVKEFPDFFQAEKRTAIGNGIYNWKASMNLNFDYLDLSDIAWRNAQAMDILHLVDFKMSKELYSLYSLQYQVLSDVNKAIEILKNAPASGKSGIQVILQDYQRQLSITQGFEKGLLEYYTEVLKQLKKENL